MVAQGSAFEIVVQFISIQVQAEYVVSVAEITFQEEI